MRSDVSRRHAGYSDPLDEQTFPVETINHLERLPSWNSTAVVLACDDSDGWCDHVMGPILRARCHPASDPSGIGTYSVTGAQFGYGLLWTAPWCYPLMATVQFICAKVGMVCGMGLAGVLRHHYPRVVLYPALALLVVANTINAGADLSAMAAAINLLVPIPILWLIAPITVAILILQIWGSHRLISGLFKWLCLALFAYIGAGVLAHPNVAEVLGATLLPHIEFTGTFVTTLVAILATTISPYPFFWQASQEVEEEIQQGRHRLWQRQGATDEELKYRAWDVNLGMAIAILVMHFIMLATEATLHTAGQTVSGCRTPRVDQAARSYT